MAGGNGRWTERTKLEKKIDYSAIPCARRAARTTNGKDTQRNIRDDISCVNCALNWANCKVLIFFSELIARKFDILLHYCVKMYKYLSLLIVRYNFLTPGRISHVRNQLTVIHKRYYVI